MMLTDHVVDERYHDVEAEQHEQPFADEDGRWPITSKEVSHNRPVYTQETI